MEKINNQNLILLYKNSAAMSIFSNVNNWVNWIKHILNSYLLIKHKAKWNSWVQLSLCESIFKDLSEKY
jgi:hypothetical protein